MTPTWMPSLACACGAVTPSGITAEFPVCTACGAAFPVVDGILQGLAGTRRLQLGAFLDQYRVVRQRDGYRRADAAYYRALPEVADDDPAAPTWRIRRHTFDHLVRFVRSRRTSVGVLDLGAGNGWLCHRLSLLGCRAVAVDLLDDDCDGLGAARHYDAPFARLVADFDELPLAPGQFDLIVFNGSLHYSGDVPATVARAARHLAPGGALAVLDSPTFDRDVDGQLMRARLHERLRTDGGIRAPILPGAAYVTLPGLASVAADLGLSAHFIRSDVAASPAWRPLAARLLGRPAPPRFGLWVAA